MPDWLDTVAMCVGYVAIGFAATIGLLNAAWWAIREIDPTFYWRLIRRAGRA